MADRQKIIEPVPVERVKVLLGDTSLPRTPLAGESQLANVLTGAVHKTALAAREELLRLAVSGPGSPCVASGPGT